MKRPDFREFVSPRLLLAALAIASIGIAGCAQQRMLRDCGGSNYSDWTETFHLEEDGSIRAQRIGDLSRHDNQLRLKVSRNAQELQIVSPTTLDSIALITYNGEYTFTLGTENPGTGLTVVDYSAHCFPFDPRGGQSNQ